MAENLQERGVRMGNDGSSAASEIAGRAREVVGEYAEKGKEMAQKGYRLAADKAQVAKRNTEVYIKENPWYAVGIALGVGLLAGMLIKTTRAHRE
jgi:ElaB/YqjD/DUF883 family membrane-anchored ribosome-binding protein